MQQAPTLPSGPESGAAKRPARWLRRPWLWLVGTLLVVPVVLVLVFQLVSAFQLSRALDDLTRRGEPVTYREVHALLLAKAPDDDDNLAKVPALLAFQRSDEGRAALRQLELEQPAQHELLHRADLDLRQTVRQMAIDARRSAQDFPADLFPVIYELSAGLHPAVHELAAATRHRPGAFWSWVEVEDPLSTFQRDMAFHGLDLDRVLDAIGNLQAITIGAIRADDPELATAGIELQLGLLRASFEGNALLGGWKVMGMRGSVTGCVHDGLNRRVWDEEQLRRLQSAIELSLPALDSQPFLHMERIHGLHVNRIYKRHRARLVDHHHRVPPHPAVSKLVRLLPGGAFDQAALRAIRVYERDTLQPGALFPPGEPSRREPQAWLEWIEDTTLTDSLTEIENLLTTDPREIELFAIDMRLDETRLRLAHAMVALERFHLKHGRYPTDWPELIPALLAEAPLDPFTGGELRLLPVDQGAGRTRPAIYSLGLNRTDNGGVRSPYDGGFFGRPPTDGDLVWDFPELEAQAAPD